MSGKVILIEGLDLAGKSTLVRNLQVELTRRGIPVRVSRNALCPDNPIAPVADALRRDPSAGLLETGSLFLASHLWDARHFQRPPAGMIHLQDSCWLRTLAYHTLQGTFGIPEELGRAATGFPSFDTAIYLTADVEERRTRLVQREQDEPGSNDFLDRAVLTNPEAFLRLDEQLRTEATKLAGATVLNTSRLTQSDVLISVITFITETL